MLQVARAGLRPSPFAHRPDGGQSGWWSRRSDAIVAQGAGARAAIDRQAASAGTNRVIVSAANRMAGGVWLGVGSRAG